MKLSAFSGPRSAPSEILDLRDLSVDELKQVAVFKPVLAEARHRLALFRVLDDNYRAWTAELQSLLHPGPVDDEAARLALDRHLLNYLNCAHHLRLHFETSFQQRLRADDAAQKKYKIAVDGLAQSSWAFAFYLDLRHYLNLEGLGLGFCKRKLSPTSVALELTLNSVELLNTTKDWPRSKLSAAKGLIDLAPLLRDLHAQLLQNYAAIVLKTLFADLPAAAEFYKKLAAEVHQARPGYSMALREPAPGAANPAPIPADAKLVFVPNDLFAELGLAVAAKK